MCLSHSQVRWIAPFLLWAALLSCSAAQHGFRLAEYEGQVLVATEGRGAARVPVEADYDSTIDEWIFQHGRPDYLHVESGDKVEFCYLAQDRAIVFTRLGWRRRSSVEIVRPVPDRLARFFVGQDRERLRSSREVASGHGGMIYATTTANIREGPGLSYPVVAKAVPAQALAYRYQQAEWYRLARHGWIHRSVVSRTVQAPPDYEIAAVEDTSIGSVKRLQYRVRLSRGASEQELTTISESIIKAAPPQNGLDILYYLPESSVDGGYTAGKADWWPYGEVADAAGGRTGDYSLHQLEIQTGSFAGPIPEPKVSATLPLSVRQEIFFHAVQLEDRGYNREQVHQTLGSSYQISPEATDEILLQGAVSGWPMP